MSNDGSDLDPSSTARGRVGLLFKWILTPVGLFATVFMIVLAVLLPPAFKMVPVIAFAIGAASQSGARGQQGP